MRKNDLIKELQSINGNPIIILSSDSIGTSFAPLDDVIDKHYYLKTSEVSGEVYDFNSDDGEMCYLTDYQACAILYPKG